MIEFFALQLIAVVVVSCQATTVYLTTEEHANLLVLFETMGCPKCPLFDVSEPCPDLPVFQCSEPGNVIALNINLETIGSSVNGTLSTVIGTFSRLSYLAIRSAGLAGILPSQVGLLTALQSLAVDHNALIGSIPTHLGKLTLLRSLALDNNFFNGSIPTELGRLKMLEDLTLHNNRLNGVFPLEVAQLAALTSLTIHDNMFDIHAPSTMFNFTSPTPLFRGNITWHKSMSALEKLRVSLYAEADVVHVLLETPSEGYVGLGFGPRRYGASMSGADMVMMSMASDGTMFLSDMYAVLDRLEPTPDDELGGDLNNWFDTHAERVNGITRFYLSRARVTADKWDNDILAAAKTETLFAVGLDSGSSNDVAAVLARSHGTQRAALQLGWMPPPAVPTDQPQATYRLTIGSIVAIIVLAIVVIMSIVFFAVICSRRHRTEEVDSLFASDEREPLPSHLQESSLEELPIEVTTAGVGLFRDPVLDEEYDEDVLVEAHKGAQQQQLPVRGLRLLAIDTVYADAFVLRNTSTTPHNVTFYLPPIAPQYRVVLEPSSLRLIAGAEAAVKMRVCMLCTSKKHVVINLCIDNQVYAQMQPVALEGELSTALDYDEIAMHHRIGEGGAGVVFAGEWRSQPVAVKLLRQQLFDAQDLAELRAEARLLGQLLHRNVVQFRGAVFQESLCCLVTELAPYGSLKSVLDKYSPDLQYGLRVSVDTASGVQFLHRSGILHRDIKSANVLVYSISALEPVVAKLTDFGSARAAKSHIDQNGRVLVGADRAHSVADGTPIYMSPQLFARVSRPSESSDCFALGVLFYEIATLREPWRDKAFAWDVGTAVMEGRRPSWPAGDPNRPIPEWLLKLINRMWSQEAEQRPSVEAVIVELKTNAPTLFALAEDESEEEEQQLAEEAAAMMSAEEEEK